MDTGHANYVNHRSSTQFKAALGHFKKPRFSETKRNPRVPLTINRSKLDIPFKSEICLLFQRGKCYYGENCHFAHGMWDIRKQSSQQRNTVNITRKCHWFSNWKDCPYGDKCQFLHERVGENGESSAIVIVSEAEADQSESKNLNAVQHYHRGNFRKTGLCHKWEKYGSCPYGVNCLFSHGQAELQCNSSLAELKRANLSNAEVACVQSNDSAYRGTGNRTAHVLRLQSKRFSTETIIGIYADWIEETEL